MGNGRRWILTANIQSQFPQCMSQPTGGTVFPNTLSDGSPWSHLRVVTFLQFSALATWLFWFLWRKWCNKGPQYSFQMKVILPLMELLTTLLGTMLADKEGIYCSRWLKIIGCLSLWQRFPGIKHPIKLPRRLVKDEAYVHKIGWRSFCQISFNKGHLS